MSVSPESKPRTQSLLESREQWKSKIAECERELAGLREEKRLCENILEKTCAAEGGHIDDGSFMVGFCAVCGACLG